MYEIPTSIKIGEKYYNIRNNGDYRMILDCFAALENIELTEQERLLVSLIIFYEDLSGINDLCIFEDVTEAVRGMYWFFNCGSDSTQNNHTNYKLVDWEQDSQLIAAAVNNVAKKEIRAEEYIHWWTFMGYYASIGECPLSTIIGIRDKIIRGKKLEKYEREFRMNNPQYFVWNSKTIAESEADRLAKELWNNAK